MTAIQKLLQIMIEESTDVNHCINSAIELLTHEKHDLLDAYRAGEYDGITTALNGKRIYTDEFQYYIKTKENPH